jgi:hypothetical protein
MAQLVFLLCIATSAACCLLLLHAHRRTRTRLLLWSGICFAGLTANNVLVFFDLVVVPQISLIVVRGLTTLAALSVFIVALIWEPSKP